MNDKYDDRAKEELVACWDETPPESLVRLVAAFGRQSAAQAFEEAAKIFPECMSPRSCEKAKCGTRPSLGICHACFAQEQFAAKAAAVRSPVAASEEKPCHPCHGCDVVQLGPNTFAHKPGCPEFAKRYAEVFPPAPTEPRREP